MSAFEGGPGIRAAFPEERCRNLPGETNPQTDPRFTYLADLLVSRRAGEPGPLGSTPARPRLKADLATAKAA
jgi:hypothetical protein